MHLINAHPKTKHVRHTHAHLFQHKLYIYLSTTLQVVNKEPGITTASGKNKKKGSK